MSEAYTRCPICKTDTILGQEIHCVLCHVNYPKGQQHKCAVLDEVVGDREPSTIPERFKSARFVFGADLANGNIVAAEVAGDKVTPIPSHIPRTPWEAVEYHPQAVPKE